MKNKCYNIVKYTMLYNNIFDKKLVNF